MRRLPFVRHLPVSKLRYRYVSCRHPVEKPRWQALWLLARTDHPRTPAEVADRRKGNGADTKLTARRRNALYAALQKRPPDGGLWTGPKIARYVRDRWQVVVRPETGWRWLRDLGFTLQGPSPAIRRRPIRPPAGLGKNLPKRVRRLKPITRRVWWLKGCGPPSSGRTKYEWLDVYGFARPATGKTFTVILPRVNVERMAAFAAHADPCGRKVLVLVVDNAGWHTAKRLAVPANVRLHLLPPCTPQLQPVEPFWALVREGVANDPFDRQADVRRRVVRRCKRLAEDRVTVLGVIGFHWATRLE